MDIKIALGKIEQYWQIIRNLHFHIEQEGEISPEEYALIDKYLSVISQKYKELVNLENEVNSIGKEAASNENQEQNQQQLNTSAVVAEKQDKTDTVLQEVTVEEEPQKESQPQESKSETQQTLVEEPIALKSDTEKDVPPILPVIPTKESPKKQKISSYLEHMLESPEAIPEQPMLFPRQQDQTAKVPSLNEKLQNLKNPVEDINSRIKKAVADKISLNNKFEFIRELFGNNPVEYATAISYIDKLGVKGWEKVETEFSTKFNWSGKKEYVEKLRQLVIGA